VTRPPLDRRLRRPVGRGSEKSSLNDIPNSGSSGRDSDGGLEANCVICTRKPLHEFNESCKSAHSPTAARAGVSRGSAAVLSLGWPSVRQPAAQAGRILDGLQTVGAPVLAIELRRARLPDRFPTSAAVAPSLTRSTPACSPTPLSPPARSPPRSTSCSGSLPD
jgi:hypothetical protein